MLVVSELFETADVKCPPTFHYGAQLKDSVNGDTKYARQSSDVSQQGDGHGASRCGTHLCWNPSLTMDNFIKYYRSQEWNTFEAVGVHADVANYSGQWFDPCSCMNIPCGTRSVAGEGVTS